MKKVIAFLLTLCLLCTAAPASFAGPTEDLKEVAPRAAGTAVAGVGTWLLLPVLGGEAAVASSQMWFGIAILTGAVHEHFENRRLAAAGYYPFNIAAPQAQAEAVVASSENRKWERHPLDLDASGSDKEHPRFMKRKKAYKTAAGSPRKPWAPTSD